MKKLTRAQWQHLDAALQDFAARGGHLTILALLNRFGLNPRSREEAMALAADLHGAGFEEEESQ